MPSTEIYQRSRRAALAATACLLVPAGLWAQPVDRPFKASFNTVETLELAPGVCPAVLAGHTTGTGQASHLGQLTLDALDCILINPASPVLTFNQGKLTLTAANGDLLRADYSGMLLPKADAPAGSVLFTLQGSYTVTGGTGRFSGATGAGYLLGVYDMLTRQAQYNANGTLRY